MNNYIDFKVGEKIEGSLEVTGEAYGGMGKVYFCRCHRRRINVVVKTINLKTWQEARIYSSWHSLKDAIDNNSINIIPYNVGEYLLMAMYREALISCQLRGQQNLVAVNDYWWSDFGQLFFECEYIENSIDLANFSKRIHQKTNKKVVGVFETIHIALSICNAFIYINEEVIKTNNSFLSDTNQHAKIFVHRDIKPNNILITKKNTIKVIDLGLSKFISDNPSATNVAPFQLNAGTRPFKAPEQEISFDNVTEATDIYAFGVTMYNLLGGDLSVFEGNTPIVPNIKNIPKEFIEIIVKCINPVVKKRFQNFKELKNSLKLLTQNIKNGNVEINENQRCRQCGYVSNMFRPRIRNVKMVEGKNGHQFITVKASNFQKGCESTQKATLLEKYREYIGPDSFNEPLQSVYLNEYEIDAFAVTNTQYLEFIKATNYTLPSNWNKNLDNPFNPKIKNHPVVGVSYNDASAYCRWLGYRLPTGDEWEKAAKGDDSRIYPWGDQYLEGYCNSAESDDVEIIDVDQYEKGRSPVGCYQMVGNIGEIVDERHPQNAEFIYVRGGCYGDSCDLLGLTFFHNLAIDTTVKREWIGFRVARNVVKSEATQIIVDDYNEEYSKCPICDSGFINFELKDIKIPDNNVNSWYGFFDVE